MQKAPARESANLKSIPVMIKAEEAFSPHRLAMKAIDAN